MTRAVNLSKIITENNKSFQQIANFEKLFKVHSWMLRSKVLQKNKDFKVGELKFDFYFEKIFNNPLKKYFA